MVGLGPRQLPAQLVRRMARPVRIPQVGAREQAQVGTPAARMVLTSVYDEMLPTAIVAIPTS
jgi:hypothetical protein